MVQNMTLHLVFNQPKRTHVTRLLKLHWLPIATPNQCESLMLAYKVAVGSASSYLNSVIWSSSPITFFSGSLFGNAIPSLNSVSGQTVLTSGSTKVQWAAEFCQSRSVPLYPQDSPEHLIFFNNTFPSKTYNCTPPVYFNSIIWINLWSMCVSKFNLLKTKCIGVWPLFLICKLLWIEASKSKCKVSLLSWWVNFESPSF